MPAAADEMRRVIAERGFAAGTAVRVVPFDPTNGDYQIEYDLPINDGRDWQTETQGLTVLIDKSAVDSMGLVAIQIDFQNGRFTFDGNDENDKPAALPAPPAANGDAPSV